MLKGKESFVGFKNFVSLFTNRTFMQAFKNSIILAVSYVVLGLIIGLVLALIVSHLKGKAQNAIKSIYFLPVVVSMVPVAIAFKWLMRSTPDGIFNYYLGFLGIKHIAWLTSAKWALSSIIIVTLWKNAGFIMVIYLAGILGIPRTYYEAAQMDGASPWLAFWRITFPLLRNTTVFLMVTGVIYSFQAFTQISVLTNGYGPEGSTNLLGFEIFQEAFTNLRLGTASAMGFVMLFFILIATIIQLKYFGGENRRG